MLPTPSATKRVVAPTSAEAAALLLEHSKESIVVEPTHGAQRSSDPSSSSSESQSSPDAGVITDKLQLMQLESSHLSDAVTDPSSLIGHPLTLSSPAADNRSQPSIAMNESHMSPTLASVQTSPLTSIPKLQSSSLPKSDVAAAPANISAHDQHDSALSPEPPTVTSEAAAVPIATAVSLRPVASISNSLTKREPLPDIFVPHRVAEDANWTLGGGFEYMQQLQLQQRESESSEDEIDQNNDILMRDDNVATTTPQLQGRAQSTTHSYGRSTSSSASSSAVVGSSSIESRSSSSAGSPSSRYAVSSSTSSPLTSFFSNLLHVGSSRSKPKASAATPSTTVATVPSFLFSTVEPESDPTLPGQFNAVPVRRCFRSIRQVDPLPHLPEVMMRLVKSQRVGDSIVLMRDPSSLQPLVLQCHCGQWACEYRILCLCEDPYCPWPNYIHEDKLPHA